MDLIYKNEKPLFRISLLISVIFWILLIVGTFGMALIYLLLLFVFYLFVQSAFISHLKGNGVKVTQEQYPDLYNNLTSCCQKLDIQDIPDIYLLRTDFFNALATRFLGKNFIVLFTDVIDALENQPDAVTFYIGHELGHIHRKHLTWGIVLAPSSILPLLGAAYRRAMEYTCDRYGTYCCNNEKDVEAAIATMVAGDTRWNSLNVEKYIEQSKQTSGFWMSYHELTNDYPWLSKRLATALASKKGFSAEHPKRSFFAWILAAITLRFGAAGGGGTNILVTIAVIGILAAVALPAYQDYTIRARNASALIEGINIQNIAADYIIANQSFPTSLADLGLTIEQTSNAEIGYEIDIYDEGLIGILIGYDNQGTGQYIILEPLIEESTLNWTCYGQNLDDQYLPTGCQ
ncbi:M48 family metalloprotease [Haliea sp. AH-315-K21]|uniref:Peptidase M48 domain-containing protein n=1 Tax=SAR86 cluster bacterium TaxID=2030880 RepID=A0A2A5CCD2_9GAMM|nr:M48 family metalloprotease [Haliea sp. AH-315-K21]PCJ41185.1 MAG: hypothetical protein COA71_09080 [SAR86 cluster bacterium]